MKGEVEMGELPVETALQPRQYQRALGFLLVWHWVDDIDEEVHLFSLVWVSAEKMA